MATEEIKGIIKEVTDTGKDVIETARDRFKNPLIGSFIISTIFFLWEPLLILIFSVKPIEERIAYIENNFNYGWYWSVPFLVTAFYVIGVPFIMWGVGWLLTEANKGISNNNIRQKEHDIEVDIGLEKKKRELLDKENTNKAIVNLNKTIDNLNNELKNRELEIENLNKKNKSMQGELTERLEKEQNLEQQYRGLRTDFTLLKDEYDLVKKGEKLTDSQVKNDFLMFKDSKLYEGFPEISEWILQGKGDLTDIKIEDSSQVEMIKRYLELGIIKQSPEESWKHEFTEKGKGFYNLHKKIETAEKGVGFFRIQGGAGTGRKAG